MGHEKKTCHLSEEVNAQMEPFFKETLNRLNLTKTQIQKQSKEELKNSLSTIEDAIRNSSSFGVLKVSMSASAAAYIVQSRSEHHFEVGILPLLLESKNLILKRLAGFGADIVQTERAMHEQKVAAMKQSIARLDLFCRLLIGFILWLTFLFSIIKLPAKFNWTWFTGHQNVVGLSSLSVVIATGLIWCLLEKSKNRRWFALGSIVIAALIGGITIL
ncbi:hypothetical protein [Candidatus Electrothrix sp.]|uniref:hypothetical protein n=2 Tax=Candidatus Electrothrix sp. TaxID=2170559 RepID=UPI0040577FBC